MKYQRSEAKEAAREAFHGIWAAIPTPFDDDYQLDEPGLTRWMRYLIDDIEIDGVFCTGVMGEFWSLSVDEWKRAIDVVVTAADGECGVIAHTGHHSIEQTIDLTRHAQEVGADFTIMITPYFPVRTPGGVYEWFEYVCERVDIGVWMFDPMYTGYQMPAKLAAEIAEIENVCGMKQAWPLDHHREVYDLCNDRIVLSQPSERDWLMLIRDFGQQVHMSSPTPYLFQRPGDLPIKRYTELSLEGRWTEAEALSESLETYRQVAHDQIRGRFDSEHIMPTAYLKEWVSIMGLPSGPVRPPIENLTETKRKEFRLALESAGILHNIENTAVPS